MNILILILIPALYALANTVDKFLVCGDDADSEPGSLMAVTGFFSLVIAIMLGGWMEYTHEAFSLLSLLPLIANGAIWIAALWVYLYVLRKEEASRTVPWFQTIPLFGIVFAFITLHELPSCLQVVGIILVIVGGFMLSLKKGAAKHKMIALMILSSGLVATYDVLFAKFGREVGDKPAILGALLGSAFWGLMFLVGKRNRRGFVFGLRNKFKLQALSEVVTISANSLIAFAKLHIAVAVVQAGCASQPLFVLGFVLVFNRMFPKVFSEETDNRTVWSKAAAIAILTVGGIVLSIST